MLYSLDQNVGKVLQCVRTNNLESRTLIIFLSDNGGHDHSPNTPLRGKKGTMWEGGIRIPFCMQWQGIIPAGSTYHFPVSSLDILPTAIAAAGGTITPDWELDGVNLLPYICKENAPEERPHNELYWSLGPRVAIRDFDYKLVSNDSKTYHLFDLKNDGVKKIISSSPNRAIVNRLNKTTKMEKLFRQTILAGTQNWTKAARLWITTVLPLVTINSLTLRLQSHFPKQK